MKDVPSQYITTPKPNVAGPALEALKYTGHEETLREMYANLLAASMDSRVADGAHPAFVEIIRQLTPDEARLVRLLVKKMPFPLISVRREYKVETETEIGGYDVLENFSVLGWEAGCDLPESTPTYIDNLCRLGLTEIPPFFTYTTPGCYDALEKHPKVLTVISTIEAEEKWRAVINRSGLKRTEMGKQFINICVVSHEEKDLSLPKES